MQLTASVSSETILCCSIVVPFIFLYLEFVSEVKDQFWIIGILKRIAKTVLHYLFYFQIFKSIITIRKGNQVPFHKIFADDRLAESIDSLHPSLKHVTHSLA